MTSTSPPASPSAATWPLSRHERDPVSTATVIVGLVTVAAIHWAQLVPTLKDAPYLGAGFAVLTVGSVGLAAWMLVSERAVVWLSIGVVNALAVAGYVFTRSVSSFFDDQDVGNWSETLGMVALFVESLLVVLSLYRLIGRPMTYAGSRGGHGDVDGVDLRRQREADGQESSAQQPTAQRLQR